LLFEASLHGLLRAALVGYMLNGQLHGELLSSHKISQASPGAPDGHGLKTGNWSALIGGLEI
jgi:hypothetical protein